MCSSRHIGATRLLAIIRLAARIPPGAGEGAGAGCVSKYSIATSTRLDSVARRAISTCSRVNPISISWVIDLSFGANGTGGTADSRCTQHKRDRCTHTRGQGEGVHAQHRTNPRQSKSVRAGHQQTRTRPRTYHEEREVSTQVQGKRKELIRSSSLMQSKTIISHCVLPHKTIDLTPRFRELQRCGTARPADMRAARTTASPPLPAPAAARPARS